MKIVLQHAHELTDAAVLDLTADWALTPTRINQRCVHLYSPNTALPDMQAIEQKAQELAVDVCVLARDIQWSDFKLLAMDMDSTVINIECIDEIADMCGKKDEVSAITEAAMRGEITNFNESLTRRLAILANADAQVLQKVLDERLQLNPGAEALIQTAHTHGLKTLLVSGGFTFFTDAVKQKLGLTYTKSNELEVIDGHLTGRVIGEIVSGEVKAQTVQHCCDALGVPTHATICMGDGANDMPMMSVSGLSVAYHAKPLVQAHADVCLNHVGLDGLVNILATNPQ